MMKMMTKKIIQRLVCRVTIALFAVSLISACSESKKQTAASSTSTQTSANPAIAAAQNLVKSGDFTGAISAVSNALLTDSDNEDLRKVLVSAYAERSGASTKAIADALNPPAVDMGNGQSARPKRSENIGNVLINLSNAGNKTALDNAILDGQQALFWAVDNKDVAALPASEQAEIASLALVQSSRLIMKLLGDSDITDSAEVNMNIANGLAAVQGQLASSLSLLSQTSGALSDVTLNDSPMSDKVYLKTARILIDSALADGKLSSAEISKAVALIF